MNLSSLARMSTAFVLVSVLSGVNFCHAEPAQKAHPTHAAHKVNHPAHPAHPVHHKVPVTKPKPVKKPTTTVKVIPVQPMERARHVIKASQYDKPSYFCSWVDNDSKPKAVLLCVHGLGLYSEAYEDMAKHLCCKGYPVYSIDARGFGHYMAKDKSLDFDGTISDMGKLIHIIQANHPGAPIVLVGESMGGAIVLQAGAKYQNQIAGIIASAPGDIRFKSSKMNVKVGMKLLTHPKKRVDWGDEILTMATSNQKLQEQWRKNPLVRLKMAPNELLKFQSFMGGTADECAKIKLLPVLFIHGGEDELMKVKGTIELFDAVPSTRKDLFILGRREHVLLEEGQFTDKTMELVETWLMSSLPETNTRTVINPH